VNGRRLGWLVVVLIAVGWWWTRDRAAEWDGRAAPSLPRQEGGGLPEPWEHAGYRIVPLARFSGEAVVLSRRRYRGDREAELAPVDLALGWAGMSEAAAINQLRIAQRGRWYEWRYRADPPLPVPEIIASSANMHLVPADAAVRRALLAVRRHQRVRFEGYLIEVRHADGWRWRSSLTRDDSGAGACEIVWTTRLTADNS
jgi:hypothetical protein